MKPRRIVIASLNPDKIREVEAVLASLAPGVEIVKGLSWPEVAENGATLEANALVKARTVASSTGLAAIADDTGLEVAALGGAPGVHTARFAGEDASYRQNVDLLLRRMLDVQERTAVFRTVVALVGVDGSSVVAEGRLEGTIARSRRGLRGFGYDPVFEVGDRTLAELDEDEKNRISHRALALRTLVSRVW